MMSTPPDAVPSPVFSNGSGKPLPKERGCFQCSRRRINCDKQEPTCGKCIKKGIECSGLGRIRFAKGVASRGKLKGLKIPVDKPDIKVDEDLPVRAGYAEVRWKADSKATQRRKRTILPPKTSPNLGLEHGSHLREGEGESLLDGSAGSVLTMEDESQAVIDIVREDSRIIPYQWHVSDLQPWIAPVSSDSRMLFSYFSEAVAPAMVVLDTVPNGYRELILPMALEDDVLRRAVGVVAAQHLSRQRPELKDAAEAGRVAIISRLRKESLSCHADKVFSKYTWATLIVLLVGETVTGSADFVFLVQMLLCVSMNSSARHGNSSATRFLQAQTAMFKFLGLPLLGEESGVIAIKESFPTWTDWLPYEELTAGSEEQHTMDTIRQCFATASTIYIRRATAEHTMSTGLSRNDAAEQPIIQGLIDCLSRVPTTSPGAHALVWVCFVAGAEATDPVQREFFVEYMLGIYARTKFANIPAGVESLRRIWARKSDKRWTQCLSELSNVLVM